MEIDPIIDSVIWALEQTINKDKKVCQLVDAHMEIKDDFPVPYLKISYGSGETIKHESHYWDLQNVKFEYFFKQNDDLGYFDNKSDADYKVKLRSACIKKGRKDLLNVIATMTSDNNPYHDNHVAKKGMLRKLDRLKVMQRGMLTFKAGVQPGGGDTAQNYMVSQVIPIAVLNKAMSNICH